MEELVGQLDGERHHIHLKDKMFKKELNPNAIPPFPTPTMT